MTDDPRIGDGGGWTAPCPTCKKVGTFHLMMMECDACTNAKQLTPPAYIHKNGLIIPNQEYKD